MTTTERIMNIMESKMYYDFGKTPQSHFEDDWGGDSLDKIEIGMNIEAEFDVSLDYDRFDNLHTVEEMANYIDEFLKSKALTL